MDVNGFSVTPDAGVSIISTGSDFQVTFPPNNSYSAIDYKITFIEPSGQSNPKSGSTIYTVNSCKHPCGMASFDANGYEYVDLELPSCTLWATMNVGATSLTQWGKFFAWGETVGYYYNEIGNHNNMRKFSLNNYAFNNGSTTEMGKYNSTDGKTTLDLSDDAARVNMGGDWHMPTQAQCCELRDNCTFATGTSEGVQIITLTSKINGNTLVFPRSGYYTVNAFDYSVRYGEEDSSWMIDVWGSDVLPVSGDKAQACHFFVGGNSITDRFYMACDNWPRWDGFVVRGVLGVLN